MKRLKTSLTKDEVRRISDTLTSLDIENDAFIARLLQPIYNTIFEDAPDPLPRCWRCGGEMTMELYLEGGKHIARMGCESCLYCPVIAEGPTAREDAIRAARVLEREFLGERHD